MSYLIWSLPSLVVAGAIGIGRIKTTYAAALGLAATTLIAWLAGALPFGAGELAGSMARGAWIGVTIAPYIFGGLLFWQFASRDARPQASVRQLAPLTAQDRLDGRRLLFSASFLVGPFAEAATGAGVGMLGTVILLGSLRIAPRQLMVFALLSQTMIPWGGMSNGTLLASTYARLPPTDMALYALIPTFALLMLIWLPLFWRTARQAGFDASRAECIREVAWIAAGLGLTALASLHLGPETALLAAYGPLIAARYLADFRPRLPAVLALARRLLPFAALIAALVTTRLAPDLRAFLVEGWRLAPYADLPSWSPLFHAGSWLIVIGIATAILRGRAAAIPRESAMAWATGKHAALSVALFALMAEVMTAAGISHAIARGMFDLFGQQAINVAALMTAALAMMSNSGNMPNSLFMSAQVATAAQAGLNVQAVAAVQHIAGAAMCLFSPVRVAIAASLTNGSGEERQVYAMLWPYALAVLAVVQCSALLATSLPG